MIGDERTQPVRCTLSAQELGAIDRMESRRGQLGAVPDVMQPGRGDEHLRIVNRVGDFCRTPRYTCDMLKATRKVTQALPRDSLSPDNEVVGHDVHGIELGKSRAFPPL